MVLRFYKIECSNCKKELGWSMTNFQMVCLDCKEYVTRAKVQFEELIDWKNANITVSSNR